ncbi:MAG: lyase family protein, partial [Rudaea sp.]
MNSERDALLALSPLDGRYREATEPLREYFSEYALIRGRLRIEIDYMLALAQAGLARRPSDEERGRLRALAQDFFLEEAARVKQNEQRTRHDVKALEYYLRDKLQESSLRDLVEWLHFGLTSEDVTQTAQALALRDSRDKVLLPALDVIRVRLAALAREYKKTAMLGRTHGQPAVPTTLGKELAVFLGRLKTAQAEIAAHRFQAKLTGAVGNLNALVAAAPKIDWLAFGDSFIRQYGL